MLSKRTQRGYETTFCLAVVQDKQNSGQNHQDKFLGTQEDKKGMLCFHRASHSSAREHREISSVCSPFYKDASSIALGPYPYDFI